LIVKVTAIESVERPKAGKLAQHRHGRVLAGNVGTASHLPGATLMGRQDFSAAASLGPIALATVWGKKVFRSPRSFDQ
jgi:hypothetical protein